MYLKEKLKYIVKNINDIIDLNNVKYRIISEVSDTIKHKSVLVLENIKENKYESIDISSLNEKYVLIHKKINYIFSRNFKRCDNWVLEELDLSDIAYNYTQYIDISFDLDISTSIFKELCKEYNCDIDDVLKFRKIEIDSNYIYFVFEGANSVFYLRKKFI